MPVTSIFSIVHNVYFGVFRTLDSMRQTLLFTTQSQLLMTLRSKPFENIVGEGEIAVNQHFLLFPQCFLPFPKQFSVVQTHLFCCLQMLSIWTGLKLCRLVMDLSWFYCSHV